MFVSCLRRDAHITVEGVVYLVLLFVSTVSSLSLCQFRGYCLSDRAGCANLSGDVVAAKHLVDKDIVGGVLAIDVNKAATAHIGHTGATEHLTGRVCQRTRGVRVNHGTDVAGLHRHLRAAAHLGMVAAAIDVAANLDLGLNIED